MARGLSTQVKGNLPVDATAFVGRRHQVSEAKRLLTETRLLTLTGIGGVGKTRLALRVAAEVRRAFPDGAWLVQLDTLREEGLLARTVARVLGMRDQSILPSAESLAAYLTDKRLLLVMDNCEHLLDACAELMDGLLEAVPDVRILATSRESLRMRGEIVLAVPPLTVPEIDGQVVVDVYRSEAGQLFTQRASAVVPGFSVGAADQLAIAQLCRRLDGIPLAIELAAVRLRVLSPGQIVERLDDRFVFLAGGYRTALPRHQTLWATVDWSFSLCSPEEQLLWARLSVFSGGFTLDAVEAVCGGRPITEEHVIELLSGLIDKSVVIHDMRDGRSRYRLLETIRQFGNERLFEQGAQEVAAVRRRHRDHYLRRALRAKADWFGAAQMERFTELSRDLANFQVALDFSVGEPGEAESGLVIVSALHGYWVFGGALGEARHWYDRLLERYPAPNAERFRALSQEGLFALMQGDVVAAAPLVAECRDYADRDGDDRARAFTDVVAGRLALLSGDYASAVSLLERARGWYRGHTAEVLRAGDGAHGFLGAFNLAIAAAFLGDERAATFAVECRRWAEDAGALAEVSMGLWVHAIHCWRAEDDTRAAELYREALRLDRSLGYRFCSAWSLEGLAWIAAVEGPHEYAARVLGIAATFRRSMGLSLSGYRPYLDAHGSCEASLRQALGDEAFEREFRRGAGLDFAQGYTYALGEEKPSDEAARSSAGGSPDPAGPAPAQRAASPPSVLTPREYEVAELIAQGLSNKEIAGRLVIAKRTAEGHVEHILSKFGFTSRTQVATWFIALDEQSEQW